jgi:hypothetical protein
MATTKTINIAGKQVQIAYCYATEVIFSDFTGMDFATYLNQTATQQTTTPKDILYAILAAAMAHAEMNDTEAQITDKDILFHATQQEITDAFKDVVALYMEWHNLPAGEQAETKQEGNGGKN